MALRLIELILPTQHQGEIQELLLEHQTIGIWEEQLSQNKVFIRILSQAEKTEAILDILGKRYSAAEGFWIILFSVEASIPRVEVQEDNPPEQETIGPQQSPALTINRLSREELYADIADSAEISNLYIIMVVLSTIVAAIGLVRDNIAIIIGSMVIAPLLGPNVAFSFATTLGDRELAHKSLAANLSGILLCFLISVFLGMLLPVNPGIPEISSRMSVGMGDIVLALASGCSGALAFTTGLPGTLIGVMVAVALLPPTVTCGMLLGAGFYHNALSTLLLLLTNIICINLAGVATFLAQGIRPIS
jgi:uncharacterized hydrophobic protein (TIGR00341 family)